MAQLYKDFFVIQPAVATLASGATSAVTTLIPANADFLLEKLAYQADTAGAAQTASSRVYPLVTCQITWGNGENLFSAAVPITSVFGNGENPFILPAPRVMAANSSIQIQLTNFDAAATYNIRLSLIGSQLKYR